MDKALEGEVGRSIKSEDKEYWIKEPEPIQSSEFGAGFFKMNEDIYELRGYFYYDHIDPKFFGITEA